MGIKDWVKQRLIGRAPGKLYVQYGITAAFWDVPEYLIPALKSSNGDIKGVSTNNSLHSLDFSLGLESTPTVSDSWVGSTKSNGYKRSRRDSFTSRDGDPMEDDDDRIIIPRVWDGLSPYWGKQVELSSTDFPPNVLKGMWNTMSPSGEALFTEHKANRDFAYIMTPKKRTSTLESELMNHCEISSQTFPSTDPYYGVPIPARMLVAKHYVHKRCEVDIDHIPKTFRDAFPPGTLRVALEVGDPVFFAADLSGPPLYTDNSAERPAQEVWDPRVDYRAQGFRLTLHEAWTWRNPVKRSILKGFKSIFSCC